MWPACGSRRERGSRPTRNGAPAHAATSPHSVASTTRRGRNVTRRPVAFSSITTATIRPRSVIPFTGRTWRWTVRPGPPPFSLHALGQDVVSVGTGRFGAPIHELTLLRAGRADLDAVPGNGVAGGARQRVPVDMHLGRAERDRLHGRRRPLRAGYAN